MMAFVRSGRAEYHQCPGVPCEVSVSNRHYACREDWRRLPQELKDRIIATAYGRANMRERSEAVQAAGKWYRDNPRGGAVVAS